MTCSQLLPDDTTVPTDAPTLSEVESAAIKKLKLGRSPGGDCIAPEMLKLAPTSAASAHYKLNSYNKIMFMVYRQRQATPVTSLSTRKIKIENVARVTSATEEYEEAMRNEEVACPHIYVSHRSP